MNKISSKQYSKDEVDRIISEKYNLKIINLTLYFCLKTTHTSNSHLHRPIQ
jgi:hypothetical protein